MLVGRSFKYHRPRGIVASGAEEPNALVNLGRAPRFEPNQRATTTELFDGLTATSQNHWPSLEFDIGEVNALCALPAGGLLLQDLHPSAPGWKHVFEPFIRQSAGLGRRRKKHATPTPTSISMPMWMSWSSAAASPGFRRAGRRGEPGRSVLLLEQTAHWGGRAPVDGGDRRRAGRDWVESRSPSWKRCPTSAPHPHHGRGRLRSRLRAGL
jgi:sarcosine oxidase subunit alpha